MTKKEGLMNRPSPSTDPLLRLQRVEAAQQNLIDAINNILRENARLKSRVKTLEIECGLFDGSEGDFDGEDG